MTALASLAKSTSRLDMIPTSTLPNSAVASSMNFPLLGGEEGHLLAHRVVDDADDDLVEDLGGAADHVEVAVRHRVIAARADRDPGCSSLIRHPRGSGSGCRHSRAR